MAKQLTTQEVSNLTDAQVEKLSAKVLASHVVNLLNRDHDGESAPLGSEAHRLFAVWSLQMNFGSYRAQCRQRSMMKLDLYTWGQGVCLGSKKYSHLR